LKGGLVRSLKVRELAMARPDQKKAKRKSCSRCLLRNGFHVGLRDEWLGRQQSLEEEPKRRGRTSALCRGKGKVVQARDELRQLTQQKKKVAAFQETVAGQRNRRKANATGQTTRRGQGTGGSEGLWKTNSKRNSSFERKGQCEA